MHPPCDGGRALVVLRSDRMDGINKCRYLEIMTLFKEYTATDVWRSFTIYAQAADTCTILEFGSLAYASNWDRSLKKGFGLSPA